MYFEVRLSRASVGVLAAFRLLQQNLLWGHLLGSNLIPLLGIDLEQIGMMSLLMDVKTDLITATVGVVFLLDTGEEICQDLAKRVLLTTSV